MPVEADRQCVRESFDFAARPGILRHLEDAGIERLVGGPLFQHLPGPEGRRLIATRERQQLLHILSRRSHVRECLKGSVLPLEIGVRKPARR